MMRVEGEDFKGSINMPRGFDHLRLSEKARSILAERMRFVPDVAGPHR